MSRYFCFDMAKMSSRQWWCIVAFALILEVFFFAGILVAGDIGRATSYGPPYSPKKCKIPLPADGMFGALSKQMGAGGALCGETFLINCVSGCKNGTEVRFKVVDILETKSSVVSFFLARKPFGVISPNPKAIVNVEYIRTS